MCPSTTPCHCTFPKMCVCVHVRMRSRSSELYPGSAGDLTPHLARSSERQRGDQKNLQPAICILRGSLRESERDEITVN